MFKIILIEPGQDSKSPLLLETMKEKHGADIILMTPNEAKENNVKPEDIFIQYTQYFPYIIEEAAKSARINENPLSGQQRRRRRRQMERKNKKKK